MLLKTEVILSNVRIVDIVLIVCEKLIERREYSRIKVAQSNSLCPL